MDINFIKGFLYGFTAAAFIGYFLGRMRKASGAAKLKDKRLDKFPDADQPNLTPAKIVRKSIWARVEWFLGLLALIFICGVIALVLHGELIDR